MRVEDGLIAACFTRAMVGRQGYDRVIDAHGATLLPAFADGHAHPVFGSLEDGFAPVRAATSVAEVVSVVAEYAEDHPQLEWLQGWGYDPTLAPQGVFRADWLDDAVPERPVVLRATDYHTAWCNSAALRAAGITASTPDPADGQIVRDGSGQPVGTLREWGATRLVFDLLPSLDLTTRVEAIERSVARYARAGVTWVQDAWVEPGDIDAYVTWAVMDSTEPAEAMRAAEPADATHAIEGQDIVEPAVRADLRFNLALLVEPGTWAGARTGLSAIRARVAALGVDRLSANTVKLFADGVIESGTAALLEPYTASAADRPGHDPHDRGRPNWDPAELTEAVTAFDADGFQVHIHAIGDAAVRSALDAIEAAVTANPPRDRRPVITHVQVVDPDDLGRFAALDVIANFEPLWAQWDPLQAELTAPRLGDRADRQYPIASILRTGAPVSFGSDWPVSDYRPLPGLAVAVTRLNESGAPAGGWLPHERLTLTQALTAYTVGTRYQAFRADREEQLIAPGAVADLVLLDRDITRVDPSTLGEVQVVGTWLAGRRTFHAR